MKAKINKKVVYALMPAVIVLLGFIIRVWKFGFHTYNISELQQVNVGAFPISEMLRGHFTSPGYYFLLHLWLRFAPFDEGSARFFSMFMGAMALIPLYCLILRLKDRKTALIAVFLAAISPFYIYHSRMIGNSTTGLFLMLLSMVFFMKLYEERSDIYHSIAYTVVTLLMLYSTPAGGLVLLCEWCWLGLKWQMTRQKIRVWMISQGVIILGYAYWVIKLFSKSFPEFQGVAGYNLFGRLLYTLHSFVLGQVNYPERVTLIIPAVFVTLLIIFIGVWGLRGKRRVATFIWPLFLINLLPVLWPCGLPEYCIGASIGWFTIIAAGIGELKFRSAVMALGLVSYFGWVGIRNLMLP